MRIFKQGRTITITHDDETGPGIEMASEENEMLPSTPCEITTKPASKANLFKKDPLFKYGLWFSRPPFPKPKGTHRPFSHAGRTMTIDLWNQLTKA